MKIGDGDGEIHVLENVGDGTALVLGEVNIPSFSQRLSSSCYCLMVCSVLTRVNGWLVE
jgi:hypothetical protein